MALPSLVHLSGTWQLAPVQAQIALAQEIGENEGYQRYLVQIEQVRASIEVGKAQAVALEKASVKILANAGTASAGLSSVGELFSPKLGQWLAGAVETLVQASPTAAKALNGGRSTE